MSKKLFVGGLSWGTTDDGLHSAFSPYGEIIEAKVITDRETGRSRGFGFVTFSNDEGATKAITEMNGAELDGRTIKVNEAEDKPPRSGGGGGGGGGGRGGYGGGGGRGGRGGGRGGRGGGRRDEF
jgi:RNA recognition motif-containing protein